MLKFAIIFAGLAIGLLVVVIIFIGKNAAPISEAEASVKQMLSDPYSAQFHNVRLIKTNNGKEIICGQVNAKNQMGGYTGPKNFAYDTAMRQAMMLETSRAWRLYETYFKECGVSQPFDFLR